MMAASTNGEGDSPPKQEDAAAPLEPMASTQRSRWATRKMTVRSGARKRMSILNRKHKKTNSSEKNRLSVGVDSSIGTGTGGQNGDEETEEDNERRLYFNLPLPDDLLDEDGHPQQQFTRNKIRTAKYTPLSFIPKNLWFQFHNVANIFFLFLVILVVSDGTWALLSSRCCRGPIQLTG
jgi:phospholipid-translocating ATPase